MNTMQLEAELRLLDERTKTTGNGIISGRSQYANYQVQAEHLFNQADMCVNQAHEQNDAEQFSKLMDQAALYKNQAEQCMIQVNQIRSRLKIMEKELLGLRAEYEFYRTEGEHNLSKLNEAAEKLMRVNSSYGGAQISSALKETKGRIVYNRNLVAGCLKRIAWIDQIDVCTEEPYVKTYGRRI